MQVIQGQELSTRLRAASDAARERLWVASPFVGGWAGNVRRILGTSWQTNTRDVRLLTDVVAGGVKRSTAIQFGRRGSVRSLLGLHAKVYIADRFVLVTSANLTGAAFARRHELGVVLTGASAMRVVRVFEKWWELESTMRVDPDGIREPQANGKEPGESPGVSLPWLHNLPPDAEDKELPGTAFGDYAVFQAHYDTLMRGYFRVQRIWKRTPQRFELDGFLNYLYRNARGTPSRRYVTARPAQLGAAARKAVVKRFAVAFRRDWEGGRVGDDGSNWRSEHAREIQRLLRRIWTSASVAGSSRPCSSRPIPCTSTALIWRRLSIPTTIPSPRSEACSAT